MSTGTHRNGASGSRRGLWIGLGIVVAVLLVVGIVAGTTLAAGGGSPVAGSATSSAAPSTPSSPSAPASSGATSAQASASTASPAASGRSTGTAAATKKPAAGAAAATTAPSAAAASHAAAPVAPRGTGVGTEQPTFAAAEKIGQTAPVGDDVSVRVTGITATQGVADGVGERSGPAVRITFELKNNTGSAVSTASAVANVEYGPDRTPADELRGKRPAEFAPSIAPGGTTTASFIYLVPTNQRGDLRITFFFDPAKPAAQFTGSAT